MRPIKYILAATALILLASCGGGNEKPPLAKQGKFVDSAVAGLNYVCGAFSGITTADGVFNFEPGSTCTFSIGGISVGSAAAAAIITPVELVAGASDTTNETVIRIAQLLQSLDADADPENGIEITSATRSALANFNLNFTGASFNSDATAAVTMAYPNRQLVDATNAKNHMDQQLLGLLAGNYECTYTGSNYAGSNYTGSSSGTAKITININGVITGIDTSSQNIETGLTGSVTASGSADINVVTGGSCGSSATFSGSFQRDGTGSGNWNVPLSRGGTWSCTAGGSGSNGISSCGSGGGGVTSYIVSTLAGSGSAGNANGINASFNLPYGVSVDINGNVYVADLNNHVIRKISSAGVVSTLAGSGMAGSANGVGVNASFNMPAGVAVDVDGNVFVADANNNMIRKITPLGEVSTFAGSAVAGFNNGNGVNASFNIPQGIALDAVGNIYVADTSNHTIRKITPSGDVSTLAGSTTAGSSNGVGANASFNGPGRIATDNNGNVFVTDNSGMVRKITSFGVVTTLAGAIVPGYFDGVGQGAAFGGAGGVSVDGSGNIYIADVMNHRIRKITSSGIVTTIAGLSISGSMNGLAANSSFNYPVDIFVDNVGYIYVADSNNNMIRKISPSLP